MTLEQLEDLPFLSDVSVECGPGWFGILSELAGRMMAIEPDCRAIRVKEKFGVLCICTDRDHDDAVRVATRMASAASSKICEQCGEPGRTEGKHWLKTLCEKHREERNVKRP